MLYILPFFALILLIYGPHLWVEYVLDKHHKHLKDMPGTGGELAVHLLEKYDLKHVKVIKGKIDENYYSPTENLVCLSPEVFNRKSLSAIAVAAHEVGHAIQFNKQEPVSLLRQKYLNKAHKIQNSGIYILMGTPLVEIIFRVPSIAIITALSGVITMGVSVLMYAAILPEEFDASFKKALPILNDYVPAMYIPAIRQVLTAAALTYVAGALADILRLWRWLAIIKTN